MATLATFRTAWRAARAAVKANRAQAVSFDGSPQWYWQSPKYTDYKSYLEAYKLPWVRACVQVIAFNAANVQYRLVKADADPDDPNREVSSSPLLDLLKQPNPLQNGFSFMEKVWTYLELTGNSFWSLEAMDRARRPAEMYLLRPDRVLVVPDKETLVRGYRYVVNGKRVEYAPDEMLHLTYVNPLDDLYGMGTIEAGEARFDSERLMAEHERKFWANGAKITGIFTTDDSLDDATFARLASQMKGMFRGSGYVTPLMERGLKYQPVSDGPAKLGLLELSKMSRDTILAMFGVPPTKLGILENANYKAQASDEFFWTETVDPKLTRMEMALQPLVERFHPGAGLKIEFDRLNFSDDLPAEQVAATMTAAKAYTINEVRAYRGKEALPGGDVIVVGARDALLDPATGMVTMPAPGVATEADAPPGVVPIGRARPTPPAALIDAGGKRAAKDAAREAQRDRIVAAMEPFKRRKAAMTIDAIWDDAFEDAAIAAAMGDADGAARTNAATKAALAAVIAEGLRRGYSVRQIVAGVPAERYGGVAAIYEDDGDDDADA
jgi:HK97 family phage portal protein